MSRPLRETSSPRGFPAPAAGLALARACYDVLLRDALAAKYAAERGALTQAVENIIEANTLLSGLGFENCGVSGGHGIHDGLTALDETHGFYHGEKVAFGTLCLLMLEGRPLAEIEATARFCRSLGLPTTLGRPEARQREQRRHRTRRRLQRSLPVRRPGARPRRSPSRPFATPSLRSTPSRPRSPHRLRPSNPARCPTQRKSSMQAAVMYKPGDIRLEDVPKPAAKKGEALLRVAAVGVCGSDIPRMLTKGAHRMPIICGHEFSGDIVDVGEGVSGFDIGELVGVAPLLPCRVCDQCATGNFSRCRNYDYFGSRRDGAYAEFVAAPVENLLKTPKGADPRAIAMTDPASIALHAVWKAPPTMGAARRRRRLRADRPFRDPVDEAHGLHRSRRGRSRFRQARGGARSGRDPDASFLTRRRRTCSCDLIIEAAGVPASINLAARWRPPAATSCSSGFPLATCPSTTRPSSISCARKCRCTARGIPSAPPFPGKEWTVSLAALADGTLEMGIHDHA